jgi:hypothetical protein
MTDLNTNWHTNWNGRALNDSETAKEDRRAMYAGAALTGLLAAATAGSVIDPEGIARNAFELADVMLRVEEEGQ